MKRFAVVVALLLALTGARAEGPDDQYIAIYNLIQEADKLYDGGQFSEALPKYVQVQTGLQRFEKAYPTWNPKVVHFRLGYAASRIAAISAKIPALSTNAPPAIRSNAAPAGATGPQSSAKAPPSDWENQVAVLNGQVHQLEADKAVLQDKLKEALAVQPAAMDPRELAKAEDRVKALQKENDLLKVSLDQEKNKPAPAPDTKALEEAQLALTETTRKLAEQTKTASALAEERNALQAKLNGLAPNPATAAELASTKQALQDANARLADQSKLAASLAQEKAALQARLQSLSADADAAAAMRSENVLLKKQLADLKSAPPPVDKSAEANRKLAEAKAQVAALQSDKEMLRLEKTALEERVTQLTNKLAAAVPSPKAADTGRIQFLERERADLQKELAAAKKELYTRKNREAAAKVAELENQLVGLRARIDVYEARQVPYTAEELELFKQPPTKLAQEEHKTDKAPASELPPGTVTLVAEAQHFYAGHQLDKAEERYRQVLQHDNKNVPTLANLAAIELDLGHYDAAEINIKQAVALAPEDSYSLFVLGRLRFCQKKYDDAVDALSRAAKADPQDAQIQNFLGLALSEKGLRGPAEAALRKAVQLDPGYANAHNNLAVAYITQQPPLVELARWHYQKALAAGQPRNPDLEKLLETANPADAKP